ncbi:MAG: hypothetical protein APR63_05655 [Desulfuromonas sp. SDB]|nr:MAG: hypothetical protein APR63_05655 [Desulfuromonas sp. SDB]
MTGQNINKIPFIDDPLVLNEGILKKQEQKFQQLLDQLLASAKEYCADIRLIGSMAFRIKCPDFRSLEYKNLRYLTDLDFICLSPDIYKLQDMFLDLGWVENQNVLRLHGDKRRIFYHPTEELHSDIFIDKLRFCHVIDFKKRLTIDYPTISLADLLLEKMQIVEINKKDLVDTFVLLKQYDFSDEEKEDFINLGYIKSLLSNNWGFYKTFTENLYKGKKLIPQYLDGQDQQEVLDKLDRLNEELQNSAKSFKWKLRSWIGDKIKWYREVEDLQRD